MLSTENFDKKEGQSGLHYLEAIATLGISQAKQVKIFGLYLRSAQIEMMYG